MQILSKGDTFNNCPVYLFYLGLTGTNKGRNPLSNCLGYSVRLWNAYITTLCSRFLFASRYLFSSHSYKYEIFHFILLILKICLAG